MHAVAEHSAPLLLRLIPLQSASLASQDARWFPIDGTLYGNEFAPRGSMGQRPGHVAHVACLIEPGMPHRVTGISEIDEHEPAFCYALPRKGRVLLLQRWPAQHEFNHCDQRNA
jgi:hypothetical protein